MPELISRILTIKIHTHYLEVADHMSLSQVCPEEVSADESLSVLNALDKH